MTDRLRVPGNRGDWPDADEAQQASSEAMAKLRQADSEPIADPFSPTPAPPPKPGLDLTAVGRSYGGDVSVGNRTPNLFGPVSKPAEEKLRADLRMAVFTAMPFLQPGDEDDEGAAQALVDELYVAAQDPDMWDLPQMIFEDNTRLAMLSDEQYYARLLAGEDLSYGESITKIAADLLFQRGMTRQYSAAMLARDFEARQEIAGKSAADLMDARLAQLQEEGTVGIGGGVIGTFMGAEGGVLFDEEGRNAIWDFIDTALFDVLPDRMVGEEAKEKLNRQRMLLQDGDLIWDQAGDNLGLVIVRRNEETGQLERVGEQAIRLDPGTKIESNADVLAAYVDATLGIAHDIPGEGLQGVVARAVMKTRQWVADDTSGERMEMIEALLKQLHVSPPDAEPGPVLGPRIPTKPEDEAIVTMVMQGMAADPATRAQLDDFDDAQERADRIATATPIGTELATLYDHEKNAEYQLENLSDPERKFDSLVAGISDALMTYDHATQFVGLNVINFLGQTLEFADGLGDTRTGDDLARLWDGYLEELKSVPFGTTLGSWLGETEPGFDEQQWGDFMDLMGGLVLDPLNYIIPGSKGSVTMFKNAAKEAATNPAVGRMIVRSPVYRSFQRGLVNRPPAGAIELLLTLDTVGTDDGVLLRLVDLALDSPAERAAREGISVSAARRQMIEEAADAMFDGAAFSDGPGMGIMLGPGRGNRQQIASFLSSAASRVTNQAEADALVAFMSSLGRERSVPLDSIGGFDAFLEATAVLHRSGMIDADEMRVLIREYADAVRDTTVRNREAITQAEMAVNGYTDELTQLAARQKQLEVEKQQLTAEQARLNRTIADEQRIRAEREARLAEEQARAAEEPPIEEWERSLDEMTFDGDRPETDMVGADDDLVAAEAAAAPPPRRPVANMNDPYRNAFGDELPPTEAAENLLLEMSTIDFDTFYNYMKDHPSFRVKSYTQQERAKAIADVRERMGNPSREEVADADILAGIRSQNVDQAKRKIEELWTEMVERGYLDEAEEVTDDMQLGDQMEVAARGTDSRAGSDIVSAERAAFLDMSGGQLRVNRAAIPDRPERVAFLKSHRNFPQPPHVTEDVIEQPAVLAMVVEDARRARQVPGSTALQKQYKIGFARAERLHRILDDADVDIVHDPLDEVMEAVNRANVKDPEAQALIAQRNAPGKRPPLPSEKEPLPAYQTIPKAADTIDDAATVTAVSRHAQRLEVIDARLRAIDEELPTLTSRADEVGARTTRTQTRRSWLEQSHQRLPQRAAWAHMYEIVGDRLGLKALDEGTVANYGYRAHDWTPVKSGGMNAPRPELVKATDLLDDGPASQLLDSLLPDTNPEMAARRKELLKLADEEEVLTKATVHSLPASPWEVLTFSVLFEMVDDIDELGVALGRKATPKKGIKKGMVRQLHKTIEDRAIGKAMGLVRRLFAWNVLINVMSPIVAGLDEVTRFASRAGAGFDELASLMKSTMGSVPGVEGIIQLLTGRTMADRYRMWLGGKTPEALAYARADQGFTDGVTTQWMHFSRSMVRSNRRGRLRPDQIGKQDYLTMVERFVNGSLMNEPKLSAVYRAAREAGVNTIDELLALDAPPQSFIDAWNGTGVYAGDTPLKLRYPRQEVNPKTGAAKVKATSADLDAAEAWKSATAYVEFFHRNAVDPQHGDTLFREIASRVDDPDGIFKLTSDRDRRLLYTVREVVGQKPTGYTPLDIGPGGGITNEAMNSLYGRPGDRRGATFFDYFFEEAYNHLKSIYEAKGKLITAEVVRQHGFTRGPDGRIVKVMYNKPDTYIDEVLRNPYSNPGVSRLIGDNGYVTEGMIRAQAARYATRQSDALMYKYAAGSMFGRFAENVFPFFRAQTDFMAWWGRRITEGNQLRYLSDPVRKANMSNGVLRAVEGFESVPLSLRPLSRYAHIAAALNNDREDSWVDWAASKYLFFPFEYNDDLLIDIAPAPGPIFMPLAWTGTEAFSKWAHERGLTDDPDDVSGALSVLWPATQYVPAGSLSNRVAQSVLPQTSKSSRSYLTSLGTAAETRIGQATGLMAEDLESSGMVRFREEELLPGYMNMYRLSVAPLFSDPSTFATLIPPSRDTQDPNWRNTLASARIEATNMATGKNVRETLSAQSPFKVVYDFDISQAPVFDSFVAAEDQLRTWGILSEEGKVGNVMLTEAFDLQRRWVRGESLSQEQQRWMMDGLVEGLQAMTLHEVMPGLTAEEWLLAAHPELALLRVSAVEVSPSLLNGTWADGSPELNFLEDYVGIGGRLTNVPAGKAGRELRGDWMDARWIVARPSDKVTEDAVRTAWLAKNRAVKAGWLAATGAEWRTANQGVKALQEVTVGSVAAQLLQAGGVEVQPGEKITRADLALSVSQNLETRKVPVEWTEVLEDSNLALTVKTYRDGWPYMQQAQEVLDFWSEQGVERFDEIPPAGQEQVAGYLRAARDMTEEAAKQQGVDLDLSQAYAIQWAPTFGDYAYEDPQPAPFDSAQVQRLAEFTPGHIKSGYVRIVDGDTLAVPTADGEMRVRLAGFAAPEMSTDNGPKAAAALEALLTHPNTQSVGLAFWEPRTFGGLHRPEPGVFRPVVWLYINGEAVFDPDAFSEANPFGIKARPNLVDWVSQLGWERDPGFVANATAEPSAPQQTTRPRGGEPLDEFISLEEQVGG